MSENNGNDGADDLALQIRQISVEIGRRKRQGEPVDELIEQSRALSRQLKEAGPEPAAETACDHPQTAETDGLTAALSHSVLTAPAEIIGLKEQWQDLFKRSGVLNPFMSWEWMSAWVETYGDRRTLRCLTVHDGTGCLVGLAPLCFGEGGCLLPRKTLGFIGSDTHMWSHHGEFLMQPDRREGVMTCLLAALLELRPQWRALKLVRMLAGSSTLETMLSVAPALGLNLCVAPDYREVCAPLPATVDEYLASLASHNRVRELRRFRRRLTETFGDLTLTEVTEPAQLDEWLQSMAELKETRFRSLQRDSIFSDPDFLRCWQLSGVRFLEQGWLRGLTLQAGGRTLGVSLSYLYGGATYICQTAFDPEYGRYGVYHLLVAEEIQRALQAGATTACFPGHERRHTADYLQGRRQIVNATLAPAGLPETWLLTSCPWNKSVRATAKAIFRRNC